MFQKHGTSTEVPFGGSFSDDSPSGENLEADEPAQDEPDITNPDILIVKASDGSPREKRDTVPAQGKLDHVEEFLKVMGTHDRDNRMKRNVSVDNHPRRHGHGEEGKKKGKKGKKEKTRKPKKTKTRKGDFCTFLLYHPELTHN